MPDTSDVVIIGGGIIGCAAAYELAKRGASVTLVERGAIGGEASAASAGILNIPARPELSPARVELSRRSLTRFPALRAELAERTSLEFDYAQPGDLALAVDAAAAAERAAVVAWQQAAGFVVEELSPAEARQREPALPEELHGVWFSPVAASVNVQRLSQTLATAAASNGATILANTPAGELIRDRGRVTGVRLIDRDLSGGTVVIAAGVWTRFFGQQVGADLPTLPVKGQIMVVAGAPVQPRHTLSGHGGFIRPRPDGTTLVAATYEPDAGFDRRVTGEGLTWLLNLTRTLCPVLLQGEVVQTWAGLRPGTATIEPMIGPVPGSQGLWVASGHNRTGAVEAAATAELVAAALTGGGNDPLLAAFAPPAVD